MITMKRILLVEDDPKDVELTVSALSEYNLANDILVARDGVEALEYLYRRGPFTHEPEGNPIVILLDLKMPRLNGIQVLREIKSDPHLQMIPVVILTSSKESQDLESCYRLGANAYVMKPVKFTEFVEAIRGLGVFWALLNQPPPNNAGAP